MLILPNVNAISRFYVCFYVTATFVTRRQKILLDEQKITKPRGLVFLLPEYDLLTFSTNFITAVQVNLMIDLLMLQLIKLDVKGKRHNASSLRSSAF